MKICSIPGCEKLAGRSRGWCNAHYKRWQRHGDPLGGGTAHGEPGRYLSEVVLAYEGDECLTWPFGQNGGGYGTLWDGEKRIFVHRQVCEHVNGPPPTTLHQAAHSCGNGHLACCTKKHLSWKTQAGNSADTISHGTSLRGQRNPQAKLTEPEVLHILALKGIKPQTEIAAQIGVSQTTISKIHSNAAWGWLKDAEDGLADRVLQ